MTPEIEKCGLCGNVREWHERSPKRHPFKVPEPTIESLRSALAEKEEEVEKLRSERDYFKAAYGRKLNEHGATLEQALNLESQLSARGQGWVRKEGNDMLGVQTIQNKITQKQAIQLTWANWNTICDFVPEPWFGGGVFLNEDGTPMPEKTFRFGHANNDIGMYINTTEGRMLAQGNDWIIKGVNGEFYACKPDVFAKSYEIVVPAPPQVSEHI